MYTVDNGRVAWVDVLRILACAMVVVSHCSDGFVAEFGADREAFLTGTLVGTPYASERSIVCNDHRCASAAVARWMLHGIVLPQEGGAYRMASGGLVAAFAGNGVPVFHR